jgi:hypothetical protein
MYIFINLLFRVQQYITEVESQNVYEHAGRVRAVIRGLINDLTNYGKSPLILNL